MTKTTTTVPALVTVALISKAKAKHNGLVLVALISKAKACAA